MLERVEFAALILIAVTTCLVIRDRRPGRTGEPRCGVMRAAVAASLAGDRSGSSGGSGSSLETQAGFAGNPRYAVLGGAPVYISGAAAYGWACIGLATCARGARSGAAAQATASDRTLRPGRPPPALMLLVFLFVPGWFAQRMPT